MATPEYTHVLSQKSIDLGRDTFIFSNKERGPSEELLIRLNQSLTCASGITLLRWLRHFSPGLQGLHLCPAKMEKSDVTPLAISVREGSIGNSVGLDLVLPPGEYIWTGSMCETPPQLSFAELRGLHANDTLLQSAVCDAIDLYYVTENNMISIHKNLIADLHNNVFGIDVDDDYSIVQFRPLKSKSPLSLPRYLPAHRDVDLSHFDPFLCLHFDWCIRANLFGGDAFREHQTQLDTLLDKLGVDFWTEEYDHLNRTDPGWLTVAGKAISEMLVSKNVVTEEEAATFGPVA